MCTICKFVTKIDETTKDNTEDLNLVMPIYNLIKYSSNCSEMTGSLWFYFKDEEANFKGGIVNTDVMLMLMLMIIIMVILFLLSILENYMFL